MKNFELNDDFTNHLRDLDNDALIQTEFAVKQRLEVLHDSSEHIMVRLEAQVASESVQREFLRRAMNGTHLNRKREPTT